MLRWSVGLKYAAAVIAALAAMASPASGASGGGCDLEGTASFTPGLSSTAQNFAYSFAGGLTGCQSSDASAPTTGTVEAGKTVTMQVTNSITGATDTVTYLEPVPTGNGSCGNSTTSGIAIVTWADGTRTVVDYATTGVLAAVNLTGTVVDSVTLNATNAQAGDPTTQTITTTRWAGSDALGALAFEPPDPTACAGAGVTEAGISGFIGLGSSA
jgi:hypothetical protein